eukprot:1619112-Rhodomonas_salina.3
MFAICCITTVAYGKAVSVFLGSCLTTARMSSFWAVTASRFIISVSDEGSVLDDEIILLGSSFLSVPVYQHEVRTEPVPGCSPGLIHQCFIRFDKLVSQDSGTWRFPRRSDTLRATFDEHRSSKTASA